MSALVRHKSMMDTVAAIVFDLDGTLVDTEPMHFTGIAEVLAQEGIELAREDYFRRLIHFTDRECFELMLRERGHPSSSEIVAAMVERKARRYLELIDGANLLYPAAHRFVCNCAARFPLALATGTLRHEAELILRRMELADCFVAVASADDVACGKPDPALFQLALMRLNQRLGAEIQARQCLVVEDTTAGIEAAHAAGMKVLAIAHTSAPEMLAQADLIRPSLAETDLDDVLSALRLHTRQVQ